MATAQPALPYGYSWHLDVVTEGRWEALITPDYRYVLPLPYVRTYRLIGRKRYFQPLLTQQLGIFAQEDLTPAVQQAFLQAIPGDFHLSLHEASPLLSEGPWTSEPRTNYLLDLSPSHDLLLKGYAKALRKRIRQARPHHELAEGRLSSGELVAFYRQMLNHKVGLQPRHYRLVQQAIEAALARQAGQIWSVHHASGELGAAGFFWQQRGRIVNAFGASSQVGYQAHSMQVLLDSLIARSAGQAGWYFDFEGSSIPSIAQFFASFGSQERMFWQVSS
jgi:hypothetical protein